MAEKDGSVRKGPIESINDQHGLSRIALIGNFLPRRCGIATFTTDLHSAFAARFPKSAVDVYAMNDRGRRYDYPPAVVATIEQDDIPSYLIAAALIEQNATDIVWIQHEYGIFGGSAGDHILKLIDRVTAPVVITLHTVLERPSPDERRVMMGLLARAARVIVMAEKGREILMEVYGASSLQIAVIPHGIPDRPLLDPEEFKPRFGLAGHPTILTFGLLSPGKGIETMIEAMPAIVAAVPEVRYVVLGATHPHLVAQEGEAYRERLTARARALGVENSIRWIDAFVDNEELLNYLASADVYVTPYLNPAQITSGTLSYAVGLGTPVVSTPYVHARELLACDHGTLVEFGDSAGFAQAIIELLSDDALRGELRQRTYALGRTMIWPRLAERTFALFTEVLASRPARLHAPTRAKVPAMADFRAIERLSDSNGMLQHSIFSIPDRNHGYCVDDNARALLLLTQLDDLDNDRSDRWTTIYAAFVQHAWNPDRGRFRNFMSFERTWLEEVGSEDSTGRTLWAIAVTARDARRVEHRRWAAALFDAVAGHVLTLGSPRAQAFVLLASAAMAQAHPSHGMAYRLMERFGTALVALLDYNRRPDWKWFEIVLAYDNCRLCEALIRAGLALDRPRWTELGLETLEWITAHQTTRNGHFRAVGSESFGRPFQPPLPFDQQPVEAWATIDASQAALDATGDLRWRDEASRAYRWFLGENDLCMPLADAATGECFDGLMPSGVNMNQGAESVLAFHLATVAINRLFNQRSDGQKLRIAAE